MRFLLLGSLLIAAVFFVLSLQIVNQERNLKDKIYPNVIINNIDFGEKSKTEIIEYFSKKNNNFRDVSLNILYKNEPIATFSGQQLRIGYDGKGIADRAYLIGRTSHFPSRTYQRLAAIFNWQKFNLTTNIGYDKSVLDDSLDLMVEKYNQPAKNALFNFENGKVLSFSQEKKGQQIETEAFLADSDKLISNLEKELTDIQIPLGVKVINPEVTLAQANEFGIEELIAEGKSDYTHSIPNRIHNLTLAASKFNGVLIPKGKVFSFNDTIGDISSLTGYQPAYIIKSGKTVLGDGGGVCQVSTTLFRAALNAGLPIVERAAHAYRVSYYENDSKPGFDATVYAPSPDLKIENNTPASILIQTEVDKDNNLLYFRFYGKKDNRKIEISPVTVYDVVPPLSEIRQDDPTLKKGVVKQVDWPAWGAKAVFNYKVTNAEKVYEKKFLSVYRPWQAVYLVGTSE